MVITVPKRLTMTKALRSDRHYPQVQYHGYTPIHIFVWVGVILGVVVEKKILMIIN